MKSILFIGILGFLTSCGKPLSTDSYVWGFLKDKRTHQPIRDAKVILQNGRMAVTDSNGFYLIDSLTGGIYSIEFNPPRHQHLRFHSIVLKDSSQLRLDYELEPDWLVIRKEEDIDLNKQSVQLSYDLSSGPLKLTLQSSDSSRPSSFSPEVTGGGGSIGRIPSSFFDVQGSGSGSISGVLGTAKGIGAGGRSGYSPWRHYYYRPDVRYIYDVKTTGYESSGFFETDRDSQSTFGTDVSTASYSWIRKVMMASDLVASPSLVKRASRPEEFINYFDYTYPSPDSEDFSITSDLSPSPFDSANQLLTIGIKTRSLRSDERKPLRLVLVVDVSGSMDLDGRLGLARQSINFLLSNLSSSDKVALVTYGTSAKIEADFSDKFDSLRTLLKNIESGGSTDIGEGLRVAYSLAARHFRSDESYHVLVFTDGVATKGQTTSKGLLDIVKRYGKKGIRLTALGLGGVTYNDAGLSELAVHGDGQYFYVSNSRDISRIFSRSRFPQLFFTVAANVVLQVTFDPKSVVSYRLVGYEKSEVADKAFGLTEADGAELGAGAEVTALYELRLADSLTPSLGRLNIGYQHPGESVQQTVSELLLRKSPSTRLHKDELAFISAVALYADILRENPSVKNRTYDDVIELLAETGTAFRERTQGYLEFAELVYTTKTKWKTKQIQASWNYWD